MTERKVIILETADDLGIELPPRAALIRVKPPGGPDGGPEWKNLLDVTITDGTYSEDTVKSFKADFRNRHATFITREKAETLITFISDKLFEGVSTFYVLGDTGPGVSAAISRYLVEYHRCECEQDTSIYNPTVFRLLIEPDAFEPMIQQYDNESEPTTVTASDKLIDLLLVFFGIRK
ncbi:hypothetical protein [Photobacterium ganghwense]|uniref:hypothetical protein n=1 Tax=Photobacterium ganghwense TaxID=320778 RepID=UPI001A8FA953|nr:hypothetical protein [Photobacterium ganghwense]QSV17639.1 hypothetical protein FH974_25455 [Photobacterium ganghwense]